ncbi:hypothetical protein [Rhizobium sp. BK176]|uniref:hypothetical protein n=1 Tax=Rhizobium sp. BK176 TaxID=2587071 RepID=UPI00216703A8|nr:hypothetical protein [Rhizobium sp. BK176]MCS4089309.1 hypothetical protein [Rhizobium sp. BK176]
MHALLRFVERSSRVPVDMHYLAMVRRRYQEGVTEEPSDLDVIESIERGSSLERYRARLRRLLAGSRVIHKDTTSTYRALGRRLIAVMNQEDRKAITILTPELSLKSIPSEILESEGIFDEEPYQTLLPEEIERSSGFLFTVERRRADRARASRLLRTISAIEPSMEVLWGRGTLKLIVTVHSRDSLKALRKNDALTVTPYVAEFSEIQTQLKEERARFPDLDWPTLLRRHNGSDQRGESAETKTHNASASKRFLAVIRQRFTSLGSLLSLLKGL